jgi:hypothetical protein
MRRFCLALLVLMVSPSLWAQTPEAVLSIDASVTLNSFKPINLFGNNTNGWASPVPVKDKIQAAGNFLLRYPGGSWGDAFFWNGAGKYEANGNWVPSDTEYAPSRLMADDGQLYDSAKAIDGNSNTAWRSNADTDYPHAQWIYLDLQAKKTADKVRVTWGNAAGKNFPYAKIFTVQYWDPDHKRQWMPYGADTNGWLNTSAVSVAGNPGQQEVAFQPVTTQYVRLLLMESSQGDKGAYSVAELKAFKENSGLDRPKGSCVASSTDTASRLGDRKIFGFEEYMAFMNSLKPKGIPLIIVNFGSGTPQMAAAWVKYANVTKKYGIKYWEIGNEMGGHWECGGPLNTRDYARRYIEFYEAMKAADPSITIVAQCGYADSSEVYDGVQSLKDFVDRLALDKKEKYLDAFSYHDYPNWGQPVSQLLDTPPTSMADRIKSIREQLKGYPSLSEVPLWVSEFNTSDHVIPDISVHLENALWITQYILEFGRTFGPRGFATMWDTLNGGTAIKDPKGADHGYMQAEEGPYQYQERADYWAMRMMTNDWAIPGDDRLHQMVQAQGPVSWLASYADYRPDGTLSLLVVNKNPNSSIKTKVQIKGFNPDSSAKGWVFDKNNYQWETDSMPYHADPDKPPALYSVDNVSENFETSFPPYSITVLQFTPRN